MLTTPICLANNLSLVCTFLLELVWAQASIHEKVQVQDTTCYSQQTYRSQSIHRFAIFRLLSCQSTRFLFHVSCNFLLKSIEQLLKTRSYPRTDEVHQSSHSHLYNLLLQLHKVVWQLAILCLQLQGHLIRSQTSLYQ